MTFLYIYGFYKEQVDKNMDLEQRIEVSRKSAGRTLQGEVLGDLSRADVQAYLLYRMATPGSDYEYRLGPFLFGRRGSPDSAVHLARPPAHLRRIRHRHTTLHRRLRARQNGVLQSLRTGGRGDAQFRTVVRALRLHRARPPHRLGTAISTPSARRFDSRLLLAPFLVNLCFACLAGDSDTTVFFLFKQGLIPFLVIALTSARGRLKWT